MVAPIVDVHWLLARRDEVVLADVRWALGGPPGRESFEAGHLPGAVFVDLDVDLAAPATTADGRHPLPDPADFAAAMSALGIGDGAVVVAYDDSKGSSAARLVWMLRALGREAALLDGGLAAWVAAEGVSSLETGPAPTRVAVRFTASPWPSAALLDADGVAALDSSRTPLLDARDHGRFTGDAASPADPRPGHVPGARNAPWAANVGTDGRLRGLDELRSHYAELGVSPSGPAPVVYCGSGVTASLDLLVLEALGVRGARLYPGSWSQWAADPARPVATGEDG